MGELHCSPEKRLFAILRYSFYRILPTLTEQQRTFLEYFFDVNRRSIIAFDQFESLRSGAGFGNEFASCAFPSDEEDEAPIEGVRIRYFDEQVDLPTEFFFEKLSDLG